MTGHPITFSADMVRALIDGSAKFEVDNCNISEARE